MKNPDCVFCKIAQGKIPVSKIYEDEICIVIPDKFPGSRGQSLVIPKKHESYIVRLDDITYNHLWKIAKKMAMAIDKSFKTVRTCFVVEGFEVPHVHIRLHPAYEKKMNMSGPEATKEELNSITKKIKENLI